MVLSTTFRASEFGNSCSSLLLGKKSCLSILNTIFLVRWIFLNKPWVNVWTNGTWIWQTDFALENATLKKSLPKVGNMLI